MRADGGRQRLWQALQRERPPAWITNLDIQARLTSTQLLRSCADDPKKASAKVGRCFRRLHAQGLIAKVPRTRRWRVRKYGRNVMGTLMVLREHHFPSVDSGVRH